MLEETKYTCRICDYTSTSKSGIVRHVISHHKRDLENVKAINKITLKQRKVHASGYLLDDSMNPGLGPPINCVFQDRNHTRTKQRKVKSDVVYVHASDDSMNPLGLKTKYTCRICEYTSAAKNGIVRHLMNTHVEQWNCTSRKQSSQNNL